MKFLKELSFEFRISQSFLSFSTKKIFLGLFCKIFFVKFPVPGPISKTVLFLISTRFEILLITFLSINKFWPNDFLNLTINFI